MPDGTSVYEFQQVTAGGKQRRRPERVETLCMRGLMLGAKQKLGPELCRLLSKLMIEQGSRITGEDE